MANKNLKITSDAKLSPLVWICGASVAIIGILGLVGRLSEIYIIGSYFPETKPISSTISICYIFLGSVIYLHGCRKHLGIARIPALIIVLGIAILGLLLFIFPFFLSDTNSNIVIHNATVLSSLLNDYPSQISALLILFPGMALFFLLKKTARHYNAVGILGVITALAGLVILIYYISGMSVYSSFVMPVPFPASIASTLLGTGIILSAGQNCFITKPFTGSSASQSFIKYFIPVIILTEILSDLIHDISVYKFSLNNPLISEIITIIATSILVISFLLIAFLLSNVIKKNESEYARIKKEKEELEKQLIQAQRIESVSSLASGIANDFNNFLTGIRSNIESLKGNLPEAEKEGTHKIIDDLEMIVCRSSAVLAQILSFSRKNIYNPKPVIINDIVRESAGILKHSANKNINISLDLSGDIWLTEVDPTMMIQVFINIGLNALDAMPAGGKLSYKTLNIAIDDKSSPILKNLSSRHYVCISISDTGKGIPVDIIPKIFDPFFTTKPAGKGSGLGLSIAYNIVKQSNGLILVSSDEGRGTEFNIYIPAATDKI